jgi:ACT domain-containing protein
MMFLSHDREYNWPIVQNIKNIADFFFKYKKFILNFAPGTKQTQISLEIYKMITF